MKISNKIYLVIATLLAMGLLVVTPAFATMQCTENISTVSGGDTYGTWNSTFFWEIGVKLNDSAVDGNITQALLQTNWTGTMTNYTMHNETDGTNFTFNVTGMPAQSGNYIHFKVFYKNTTGANATCLDTIRFKINQSTASTTLSATTWTITAPTSEAISCSVKHNTVSSETILPTANLWLTQPASFTGVEQRQISNGFVTQTLQPGVYTTKCNFTGTANYTTNATGGSNTLTVNAGGVPIQTVSGEGVSADLQGLIGQYWWLILIIAVAYLKMKKKI